MNHRIEILLDDKQNAQIERAAKLLNLKRKPFLEKAALSYSESILSAAKAAKDKKQPVKKVAKPKGAK